MGALRMGAQLASIAQDYQPIGGVWSNRVEFDKVGRERSKAGKCLLAKRGHEGKGMGI
jgi:hypothetical protein